ncbi:unnamed protein product [Alopecurus aequalis]
MENGAGIPNGAAETPVVVAASVVREQDRLMPIANVIRIMRRVLPPHAKISDDAKELIQECVSEFISFVTGEANERCHAEHRKTVTAEDVVWAMDRLGFDDYVQPLAAFLQRMREREAGAGAGRAACDGRGAMARAPHTAGSGVQVQIYQAMYAAPAPVQGYSVAMPSPLQAVVSPCVGGYPGPQCDVFRTERAVARRYQGDGAYGAGSSGCGDEESSSNANGAPAPATGTALPDPQ